MTVFYVCRRAVLTILIYVRCFEWEVEHYGGSTAIISLALVVSKFLCPPNSPVMDPHRRLWTPVGCARFPIRFLPEGSSIDLLIRSSWSYMGYELFGSLELTAHILYKLRTQVASWLRWLDVYVRLRL